MLYATLGPWEISFDNVFRKFFPVHGAFYMYLGILFRMGLIKVRQGGTVSFLALMVGLIGMALKVFLQMEGCSFYYYIGFLSCPLVLLGVFNLVPDWEMPRWLATCSFSVYLFHMFVIKAIHGMAVWVGFSLNANLFIWMMSVVAVFLLSVGMVCVQRKYMPKLNGLLWGGR